MARVGGLSLTAIGDSLVPNVVRQQVPTLVNVPVNYVLNFTVTPLATVSGWSNILHYSATQSDSSRIPAIWFVPGTTNLHVRFSTASRANDGFNSDVALPLSAATNVSIRAYRQSIQLFLNGSLAQSYTTGDWRVSGDAYLYVSDPWYTPVMARVGGLSLTAIGDSLVPNVVRQQVPTQVNVPVNYVLNFTVTPLATVSGWSNILHYSATQSDSSRIPAIWFVPGATNLHVRFSTTTNANDGFNSNVALPLSAATRVSVKVNGTKTELFLNGTFSQTYTVSGTRIFGDAYLYVSDPWYAPVMAKVEGISLAQLVAFDPFSCDPN